MCGGRDSGTRYGAPDRAGLAGLAHIAGAPDLHAAGQAGLMRSDRAGNPRLRRLAPAEAAEEALARGAQCDRAAEDMECRQLIEQAQIVRILLAEAEAGIE